MEDSGSRWPDSFEMTLRTKHQSRRSQVHHELSRELMLKKGAENLLNAKIDSKARKKAEMELSFYTCKLEMLREELNELNSSVLVYQTVGNATTRIPLLPIPMKETERAKFNKVILPMLIDHYHVNVDEFSQPLQEINRMREMAQQSARDKAGLELLFEYCNQLYFIDRRFYPTNRKTAGENMYFQWFDLWSGNSSAQRSIAFEKANIMFNIAALYSQMAIEQDRSTEAGLEEATMLFEQAAGMLQLMSKAFINSPSLDISNDSVNVLYLLMMAQATECNWEKIMIQEQEGDIDLAISIAKETCHIAVSYKAVADALDAATKLKDEMAPFWNSMVQLKHKHFQALTCFYAGIAHVEFLDDDLSPEELKEQHKLLMDLQESGYSKISSKEDQLYLGFLYFNAAVKWHEDSQQVAAASKEVKKLAAVRKILELDRKTALSKTIQLKYLNMSVDLSKLPEVKADQVLGKQVAPEKPDFNKIEVVDFFRRLGPSAVFNANIILGPPHDIIMTESDEGFGFVIRGNRPVKVRSVDRDSPADIAGLKRGDVLVAINGEISKFMTHDEVVGAIRLHNKHLILTVMSPENVDQVLQITPPLTRTSSVIVHNPLGVSLDSSPDTTRKSASEYGSRLSTVLSGICEEVDEVHKDMPSEDVLVDKSVTQATENNAENNTENNDSLHSGSCPEDFMKTDDNTHPAEANDDDDDDDEDQFVSVQQVQLDVKVQMAETMIAEDEDQ